MKVDMNLVDMHKVTVDHPDSGLTDVDALYVPKSEHFTEGVRVFINPAGDNPSPAHAFTVNRPEAVAVVRLLADLFGIRLSEVWNDE